MVPVGDRHHSDVGSPSADPIKILREGRPVSVGGLSFYRPAWIFGASPAEIRPRIRLVRRLHTVLNRDSS